MKNKIIFGVLVALISFIGLIGTDITERLLGNFDAGSNDISRSSVKSGAVYISSDSDISFDPMKCIDEANSVSIFSSEYLVNKYCDYLELSDLLNIIVRCLSYYSDETAFSYGIENLATSVYCAPNGYYYVKEFEYNKFSSEKRYVDIIIDSRDLSIIYIRFYSKNKGNVSAAEAQAGLERLKKMSMASFDFMMKNYVDIESYSEILYNDFGIPYNGFEHGLHYDIEKAIMSFSDNMEGKMRSANESSFTRFFLRAYAMSLLNFTRNVKYGDYIEGGAATGSYEAYAFIYGLNKFIYAAFNSYEYEKTNPFENVEYAFCDDLIYQTFSLAHSGNTYKFTVIYNFSKNMIEGLYSEPYFNVW